jgi:hypothetical protein
MTRRFVGWACLAMGMCLLFLAFGMFQAQAFCTGDEDCGQGGCVGSTAPCNVEGRLCTGSGFSNCGGCNCVKKTMNNFCTCSIATG